MNSVDIEPPWGVCTAIYRLVMEPVLLLRFQIMHVERICRKGKPGAYIHSQASSLQ